MTTTSTLNINTHSNFSNVSSLATYKRTGKTGMPTDDEAYFEIYRCERAIENLRLMLKDRKYDTIELVPDYVKVLERIFLYEDENYQTPILTATKTILASEVNTIIPQQYEPKLTFENTTPYSLTCFVFISPFLKIRISSIRGYADELAKTPDSCAIILSSLPPNPAAIAEADKKKLPMQILTFDDLTALVKSHHLCAKVIPLTKKEEAALLKSLGYKTSESLPSIQLTNPLVKYFGFSLGTVLKTQFKSNPPYYRVVVNGH